MDVSIEKTIERLSDRNLEKVARFWEIDLEDSSDRKDIAEKMKRGGAIKTVINKLSSREKDILGIFAIKDGVIDCNGLYDFRINEAELGVFPSYHWQSPKGLLGNALIAAVKKHYTYGPTVFVVPNELREGIIGAFSESIDDIGVIQENVKKSSGQRDLLDGLFRYLTFVSVERPALTKSLHQLPKRYLEKIGLTDHEFSFIKNICKELDLVKKGYSSIEDEYFLDTTKKTEEFISREDWERAEDIFNFVIRNAEKNEIFSINGLKSLKVDKWYNFDLFLKNLKNELFLDKKFDEWGKFDRIRVKHFFDHLAWLGLIEIGRIDRSSAFSITPIGAHVLGIKKIKQKTSLKKFMIQPNFEITVFPETSKEILFNLAKFTEIETSDKVSIYLLTKNSVLGAVYRGLDIKWIIEFLQNNSQKEIPQNVLYSLEEWGSGFGEVKFKKGTFLEADEDLTSKIKSKIEPYIMKEVSPTTIVVKEKDVVSDLINMHDEVFLEIDDPVRAKEIEQKIERYIVRTFPNVIVIKKESMGNVVRCLKKNGIYPKTHISFGDIK